MPRGSKNKYTAKQQRRARHIEEGYEKRGASTARAERIAWATVNKIDHGGLKKGGGGWDKSKSSSLRQKGRRA
jgi:hypothetical protein